MSTNLFRNPDCSNNFQVKPEFLGVYTPRKWLSTFVELGGLKRDVIREIYTERETKLISFSTVSDLLLRLRKWHQRLPSHLKFESWESVPPFYKRAIIVLQLHYWSTKIILTRPFLLNFLLKGQNLAPSSKIGYVKMAEVSIDAAKRSVGLFQTMIQDGTASALTTFDSTTLLRSITIFMCAYGAFGRSEYKKDADDCVNIARQMEQIGFAKMIVEETPIHLKNLGMSHEPIPYESYIPEDPVNAFWNSQDRDLTSIQHQQALEISFDDQGALDSNFDGLLAFEPDESAHIFYQPQRYPKFNQQWQ